jgi:hypothetical protein
MDFLTVRELTTSPREVWKKLKKDGELAITNNGKPTAIMLSVADNGFDETVRIVRQVKTMRLLNSIWAEADERGPLSGEDIEKEIRAAREKTGTEDNA